MLVLHYYISQEYLCIITLAATATTRLLLLGIELKSELVDQSQNDTIHTNESYRSPLISVYSCRGTQFDMFHPQKNVWICFQMTFFSVWRLNSPKTDQICSLGDNLITSNVKGDFIVVKTWDNTFGHRSERYRVGFQSTRGPKLW